MVAALALAVPTVGAVATSPSAEASSTPAAARATLETVATCWGGGTRVRHSAVKAGSRTVGYVNVYRYSGRGKCAQFAHAGASKGRSRYTTILVKASGLEAESGGTTTTKSQGIRATGVTCITARGTIRWSGKTRSRTVRACTS